MKEDLSDATLKAEQLRSQILDITTRNRNKIKESKNWISAELETINNSITMPDTGLKGLTSLQMQTKAKTKTGNTSDSSTNTKTMIIQTQNELSPPPLSQPPPPHPSSPSPPLKSNLTQHNEIYH